MLRCISVYQAAQLQPEGNSFGIDPVRPPDHHRPCGASPLPSRSCQLGRTGFLRSTGSAAPDRRREEHMSGMCEDVGPR